MLLTVAAAKLVAVVATGGGLGFAYGWVKKRKEYLQEVAQAMLIHVAASLDSGAKDTKEV